MPRERVPALDRLAADCVTRLDRFRAPLTAADRARRRASLTSDRLRENLEAWGYPYVFDDFRFHMTLTGALPEERRLELENLLGDRLDTRVKVTMSGKRGRIVVEFSDLEDLERIYRVIAD